MEEIYLTRWADLLCDYCLRVQRGEQVVISSEITARPLVEACYRAVLDRGGHPVLRLSFPGLERYYWERATSEQLEYVSALSYVEAELIPARIRIEAPADTAALSGLDPKRQAQRARAQSGMRRLMSRNRWVLTQYPTSAYAADARMPLEEYEQFVLQAMFLDDPNPDQRWWELGQRQANLVNVFSGVKKIHITSEQGTDLHLDVTGRTWINSDGRRNMPSGEIFTGPVEDSVQGRLYCSFPVRRDGHEVRGVSLEFENGVVTQARADHGEDFLLAMLDTDAGSRRLGELGVGLNQRIQTFTGSILYDEKIGGTIHCALGQSYPETGGVNNSALHWDLIVDLRESGRITADGQVLMENGRWLVGQ